MVVGYLNDHGYPHAERRRLMGVADQGDIAGIPGVVIEVKGDRSNRIAEWREETTNEMNNAKVHVGILVVRVERQPVEKWDVHVPLDFLCETDIEGFAVRENVWVRMDLKHAVMWLKETGY